MIICLGSADAYTLSSVLVGNQCLKPHVDILPGSLYYPSEESIENTLV